MKISLTRFPALGLCVVSILVSMAGVSCKDNVETISTYRIKKAVQNNVSAFRAISVEPLAPHQPEATGKIYVYGKYLFVNEPEKGIHVYDNTNPSAPKALSFINIPGNVDIAVNTNILYADSYVDLLAFDISDPRNVKLVKRVADAFPGIYIDQAKSVFLSYKDTVVSSNYKGDRIQTFDGRFFAGSSTAQSYGTGGSMARFTLMNGHLYTVNSSDLLLFNVDNPANPSFIQSVKLGFGIETIFPYNNRLFIGSTTGMHIYDATVPASPVKLAIYSHFTSCDPVVVSGKYAFVTLRSGTNCRMGQNVLDVVDIENITSPKLVVSYPMQNPHGLGISGNTLFLGEGKFGLKTFDISDVMKINQRQLEHIKYVNTFDVIPASGTLITTGPDGIYQFSYADPKALKELSRIPSGAQK